MPMQKLLMISRDDILDVAAGEGGDELYRKLARFTRQGFHLLVTAPQPDRWNDEHGGPDIALLGPDSIRRRLADAGGILDGVYYVPRSLMTQRRNREEALHDMMQRFSARSNNCYLFSSSRKFVDAASDLGINARFLQRDVRLMDELDKLLLAQSEATGCD
ncbi:MAG: hypothetical protein RQ826_02375 [Xanthomonadales bacterium]|nr:hypothetical protein [Xanthomonadales bacterium]